MKAANHTIRRTRGSFIAESPLVLWLLFMGLTFPLLDLATIGLRSTFLLSASRQAAEVASKCKSFKTNISTTDLSAINAATNQATSCGNAFSGVTITKVTTEIVVINLTTLTKTVYTAPLTLAPNTSLNLYDLQVTVTGTVKPLITYRGFIKNIPGLTAPLPLSATSEVFCEFPQGLTQ